MNKEAINRIKELIDQLDEIGKPTTMNNICIQSLFSTGGTIVKSDCFDYLRRDIRND